MKCPLCNPTGKDTTDYTLDELDEHLKVAHDMLQDEREQFGEHYSKLIEAQIELENSFEKLLPAIEDSIRRIEKHDSLLIYAEVHGPHSGYKFEFQGFGAPEGAKWKRTPIEK